VLANAVERHPPPLSKGRRVKLRYAHQGGSNPPRIIIHGGQTDAVSANYERYLMRIFRDVFDLHGTPVKIEFRTGDNPFKDRKNTLTKRQVDKRRRLMKHVKHRK
jgi:GTP-binding protein